MRGRDLLIRVNILPILSGRNDGRHIEFLESVWVANDTFVKYIHAYCFSFDIPITFMYCYILYLSQHPVLNTPPPGPAPLKHTLRYGHCTLMEN